MSMIWDEEPADEVLEIGSPEWEEKVDELLDKIHADIEKFGWSAIYVYPDASNPVPFGYTVGMMETYGHPELIVYGLGTEDAHGVLRNAARLIKNGEVLTDGESYKEIVDEPYSIEARSHHSGPPMNWATKYYDQETEAIQLVWPDKEGLFPGEEGCNERINEIQQPQGDDMS